MERFFLPLASALMPIPSLAWVPVFILWFGLGNTAAILIVFYAASFPMLVNTWSGVRAVNPLWLRAAGAMGAGERGAVLEGDHTRRAAVHHHGPAPGFPARVDRGSGRRDASGLGWGLGWVIFDAKEFLNADVMLAALAVIGADRLSSSSGWCSDRSSAPRWRAGAWCGGAKA